MEVIFSFCIQCHLSAHATNGHVKTFFFKVKVWNCTFKKKKSPFMPHDEFNCFVFNDESYHSENHYLLMSFFCQVTDKYSEWMLSDYCFTEFC